MNFIKLLREELKAFFSFIAIPAIVFGGSILYLLLYPTPYMNDTIQIQQIAIVDKDDTAYSKELIFLASASPYLHIKYILGDHQKAQELLQQEAIMGVLSIPRGFEEGLYRGIPITLNLEANAAYFLIYGSIIENFNHIINDMSNQIRLNKIYWQSQKIQNTDTNLVHLNAIPLYNPSIGYINYALAAIFIFILQQTSTLSVMLLGSFQNSQNQKGILGYWNEYPIIAVFIARLLVFGGFYILLFLLFFGQGFAFYGVNIQAHWIDFWCFALMFIFCCISLGILLGTLLNNPTIPTQIILVCSIPLIFMMGFVWPSALLPQPLQFFANLVPVYHGITGFIKLNQMGASLHAIMPHFYTLSALFILFCTLAYQIASSKRSKTSHHRSHHET